MNHATRASMFGRFFRSAESSRQNGRPKWPITRIRLKYCQPPSSRVR